MVVQLKKLILFSSPIGNLKDLTINFIEKIKEVDIIFAENPNQTIKLLNHLNIKKKMIKYHESEVKNQRMINIIENNDKIGFISSAGAPNIEDPSINLIKYAIENNIEIEIVPGASALCSALMLSPLQHTPFLFLGFLDKKNKYLKTIENSLNLVKSIVFFESCHRIRKTINNLKNNFPEKFILILHEMTKINQKIIFTKLKNLDENSLIEKGEYTLILYNKEDKNDNNSR